MSTSVQSVAAIAKVGASLRRASCSDNEVDAHALVGMVTFVRQWWTHARKPAVEEVASHIAALAWMGLRHLPKRPAHVVTRRR